MVIVFFVYWLVDDMGWCDDFCYLCYNSLVDLLFDVSYEKMWWNDWFYDIVVVFDCNMLLLVKGWGSVIFFYIVCEDYWLMEGCIVVFLIYMWLILLWIVLGC